MLRILHHGPFRCNSYHGFQGPDTLVFFFLVASSIIWPYFSVVQLPAMHISFQFLDISFSPLPSVWQSTHRDVCPTRKLTSTSQSSWYTCSLLVNLRHSNPRKAGLDFPELALTCRVVCPSPILHGTVSRNVLSSFWVFASVGSQPITCGILCWRPSPP